jgi:predicted TPR repeat methyltransferase
VAPAADPYAALAQVYDEWHEALALAWVVRLENQLAQHFGTRETLSLLDLGCGTGTLLVSLRARHPGWRLAGLDASAAMLSVAKRKPGADSISWTEATFEAAARLGAFDVVGCFFDAFNHLLVDGELARAFLAAAGALAPGGLFVFDLNNRRGCEDRSNARTAGFTRPSWEISAWSRFDAVSALETTNVTLRLGGAAPVQTAIVRRCFDPADVAAALDTAGLAPQTVETWSFRPGEIAGKTWYVARKADV